MKLKRSLCFLIILSLFSAGCGYKQTMGFRSPSGKHEVKVFQTRLDNSWGMRIVVEGGGKDEEIYRSPNEAFLSFVHVYWTPNEQMIGIFTGQWNVAYDLTHGKGLAYSTVEDEVARSIRREYHLAPDTDLILWADGEGSRAFFRRHPEIRLTYGPSSEPRR